MKGSAARWTAVVLAVVGAAIAAYLTTVQAGGVDRAWDPVFGRGSDHVLRSSFSRSLPFPDAAAGLVAYVLEAILGIALSTPRWGRRPLVAIAFDLVGLGLAAAAVGLFVLQAFVIQSWCLLCLASALVSWTILAVGRLREGRAAIDVVRRRRREERPWSTALLQDGTTSGR